MFLFSKFFGTQYYSFSFFFPAHSIEGNSGKDQASLAEECTTENALFFGKEKGLSGLRDEKGKVTKNNQAKQPGMTIHFSVFPTVEGPLSEFFSIIRFSVL